MSDGTGTYRVHPTSETVVVTPRTIHVVYDRDTVSDTDVIGLYLDDPRLGELFVVFTPEAADTIATRIRGTLDRMPELRSEFQGRANG